MEAEQAADKNHVLTGTTKRYRAGSRKAIAVIAPGDAPEGALRWRGKKQKYHAIWRWRRACKMAFKQQTRELRICWTLESFISDEGFAFCGDRFLAAESDMAINKVAETLTALERAGAIIRCHARVEGKLQRRIYLGAEFANTAPPTLGGTDHPPTGEGKPHPPTSTKSTPRRGWGHILNKNDRFRTRESELAKAALDSKARRAALFQEPENQTDQRPEQQWEGET